MNVRNLFPPYREKGRGIRASAGVPEFDIAGMTLMIPGKVRRFQEPEVSLRTPEGTVFPLTRREYVRVTLPSGAFSPNRGSFASLSLYLTAPGKAMLRNCPKGTKIELSVQTIPSVRLKVKMIFRPETYSKQIEKDWESVNIL